MSKAYNDLQRPDTTHDVVAFTLNIPSNYMASNLIEAIYIKIRFTQRGNTTVNCYSIILTCTDHKLAGD